MQHLTFIFLCIVTVWGQSPSVVPFKNLGLRIINGEKASKGQFPWQAAIYVTQGGSLNLCGGALISDKWILTAAHCVQDNTGMRIALGSNQLTGTDSGRRVFETADYFKHENFSTFTLSNDIALIPVDPAVTLSDVIQPIALAKSTLGTGTTVTVSGWGLTSDGSSGASPDLNYVDLVTISGDDCRNAYGGIYNDGVFCAAGASDEVKSTCEGDSGGPLVVTNADGTATHVGIVSYGHPDGCESGKPAGFSDTSYFRDWIKGKTGI